MRGPFENPQFRRLFAGRVVTNVGDSLYYVGAMWLVYALTEDPFYSGLAGFLTMAPSALQFLFGPLVDRWSLRRVLVGTQLVQGVVVLVVPLAAAVDALTAGVVLVVMPLLSVLNQMVYPAQSAALPKILDDEQLVAANAAFSVAYQGVDMVANAAAGAVVALVGAVSLFVLDSVTFLLAAALFATVVVSTPGREESAPEGVVADGGTDGRPADGPEEGSTDGHEADPTDGHETGPTDGTDAEGYFDRLREGAGVVRGTFLVWLVVGAAVVNFSGGMALAAMPAYGAQLGGAGSYGLLMAGFAAGNFLGAAGSSAVDDRPMGRLLVAGFAFSALAWTGGILLHAPLATPVLVGVAMVPAGVVNVQLSAVVQSAVSETLVGRVSSLLGSATAVAIPVGSLVGGSVAGAVGPWTAMAVNGVGLAALSVYALAVPSLRSLPAVGAVEIAAEG